MKKNSLFALALVLISVPSFAAQFEIDTEHSSVQFKIRHLVGKVTGKFAKFNGGFEFDSAHPEKGTAKAVIDVASIDTGIQKRDNHLRSPDFFDAEKFKTIEFVGTKASDVTQNSMNFEGNLTMHGVTKPVVLKVELNGEGPDPKGNRRAGFTGTTRISRKDFGMSSGTPMVGDDVDIEINVEGFVKAKK